MSGWSANRWPQLRLSVPGGGIGMGSLDFDPEVNFVALARSRENPLVAIKVRLGLSPGGEPPDDRELAGLQLGTATLIDACEEIGAGHRELCRGLRERRSKPHVRKQSSLRVRQRFRRSSEPDRSWSPAY